MVVRYSSFFSRTIIAGIVSLLLLSSFNCQREPGSSVADCGNCHVLARVGASLPGWLQKRLDPLGWPLVKGATPLSIKLDDPSALKASSCLPCHKTSYDTWKRSKHADAWRDPVFRVALRKEPMRWCVNCHAPLAEQQTDDPFIRFIQQVDTLQYLAPLSTVIESDNVPAEKRVGAQEGINCAVCHIRDGYIYAAPEKKDRKVTGSDPEGKECLLPIKRSSSLTNGHLCAGCHQFNFPAHSENQGERFVLGEHPMQNTLNEYGQSLAHKKGKSCSGCHFSVEGKVTHDTAAGTQGSVQVSFSRQGVPANSLMVEISVENPGHYWPTGDLYRSIVIETFGLNGELYDRKEIFRLYNPDTKELAIDTRLQFDTYSNYQEGVLRRGYVLSYKKLPVRCRVVFHDQGVIEKNLKKEIGEKILLRQYQHTLFDGICLR